MKFYTGVYGFKSKKDKKLIEVIQNKALEEYSKKHVAKKFHIDVKDIINQ